MSLGAISLAMAKNNQAPSVDRGSVIYRALRHAIIEQAIDPGAKLPEDAIGEQFGASRTIVRNALANLRPKAWSSCGATAVRSVAAPSWDEARDIFDFRLALERSSSCVCRDAYARAARALTAHVDKEENARGRAIPFPSSLPPSFTFCWRR